MDFDEGKDKVYVNLNIQHDPKKNFFTNASETYKFLRPIIDKGGNYQVSVTDMQVDTRAIPLFMAEFFRRQTYDGYYPPEHSLHSAMDSRIILDYWVQCMDNLNLGEKVYLKKPIKVHQKAYTQVLGKGYLFENETKNAEIHTHQEFIDMVNAAIEQALPSRFRNCCACGFLIRNGKLVFLVQNVELYKDLLWPNKKIRIQFSRSLYPYLGIGFPVTQINASYWEYNFLLHIQDKLDYKYYSLVQTESTLQSWNSCKAIVCYSLDLPISDEIFPTLSASTELNHYYEYDHPLIQKYGTQEIYKKILYVHYIDYNKVKTLGNGIVIHNACIDSGVKIDVEKALPIEKFDINLAWMDNFGNLFPIKLGYGGCCNVRLCFTRKYKQEHYDYTQASNIGKYLSAYVPPSINDEDDTNVESMEGIEQDPPIPLTGIEIDEDSKQALYAPERTAYTELDDNIINDPFTATPQVENVVPIITFDNSDVKTPQELEEEPEPEPEAPTEEVQQPPLDEKEEFYRRQDEIFKQYIEFNNSLNKN